VFSFSTADFDYDQFQNLDLRTVLGGGMGVKVWKGERGYFDPGSGGAWNRETLSTGLTRSSGELLCNQESACGILNRVNLTERVTSYPNLTQTGQYRLDFDTTASVPVFKRLEWALGVNNRFLSNPLPGRKTNALLVTMGIRFAFYQSR
jgi:hypothetical protein